MYVRSQEFAVRREKSLYYQVYGYIVVDARNQSIQAICVLLKLHKAILQFVSYYEADGTTHLSLQKGPHPNLLIRLDDEMEVVEILDDEALFFV